MLVAVEELLRPGTLQPGTRPVYQAKAQHTHGQQTIQVKDL